MLKLTMCMMFASGLEDGMEIIDHLDVAAVGRLRDRLPHDVIAGRAAQLERGVEDDREAEDEDQKVEKSGALKHCWFSFAERNCSTSGGRLTFCRIEFTIVATAPRHPVVWRLAADRPGLADAIIAAGFISERNALPN